MLNKVTLLIQKIIKKCFIFWWLWILIYLQYQVWLGDGGWYDYYNIKQKVIAQEEINLVLKQQNQRDQWILSDPQHQKEYLIHYGVDF
jgi:hypothetical protein